jgi:rhodanese-related sulfurtransferase
LSDRTKRIEARQLMALLHDGGEIALLDVREEGPFSRRHLLMASCIPLSRLELLVDDLVPRRAARVVCCDDGDGPAERAAARMSGLGYRDVAVLGAASPRGRRPAIASIAACMCPARPSPRWLSTKPGPRGFPLPACKN